MLCAFLKKMLELLLGIAIILVLMVMVFGLGLLVGTRGFRWAIGGVFVLAGAALAIGSGLNPMAYWVNPFRPRSAEVTPAMETWAGWILATLGTGFVVAGIGYVITGYVWLISTVLWVSVLLYMILRWRITRRRFGGR